MTVLRGATVLLRGFRPEEVDLAMRRIAGGSSTMSTPQIEARRRGRLESSGARNDWEVLFAIEADGRLVGDCQARCSDQAMPPGVWEVGLEVWDEAERGRGTGREATGLLTSYLFEREGAIRVQATTDVDNAPMCRVLQALGFTFEGTLRGFMPTADGPPRDCTMYGMTRQDWDTKRGAWTRTS